MRDSANVEMSQHMNVFHAMKSLVMNCPNGVNGLNVLNSVEVAIPVEVENVLPVLALEWEVHSKPENAILRNAVRYTTPCQQLV